MEELLFRFPHVGTKIFEELNSKNVAQCQKVTRSWKSFIDAQKFLWIRKIRRYIHKSKEPLKYLLKFINIEDIKEIADIARKPEWLLPSSILHFSAVTGNTDVFRIIFEKSSEKCPKDYHNRTPFHYAAERGHSDICWNIMENLNDKNPKDINDSTPLHKAAINGHLSVCQLILENTAVKNPKDKKGRTPLHYAATFGYLSIYQEILNYVSDINPPDLEGRTPLHEAACFGHTSVCELIIDEVSDKNPKTELWETTPLHLAAANGHIEVCKLIAEKIDDTFPTDHLKNTPFDRAANNEHFEICQFFEVRYQCDADLRPFVAVLGHLFVYCRCLSSTLFAGQILPVVCSNNHLAFFAILPVSIKTKNTLMKV